MQCVQKVSIFSWKFYFLMVLLDLVWSDPEEVDTWAVSPRGAGWLFGAKVTNEVSCKLFSYVCGLVCLNNKFGAYQSQCISYLPK